MRSVLFAVLLLTGCATATPDHRPPATVDVPVAISCLPVDRPVRPTTYSDRDLAALDDYKLVLALRRDSLLLWSYARQLESLVKGCE
jgi:hypothetical protein